MLNFNKFGMKIITYIIVLLCSFSFLSSNTHGFGGGSLSTLSVTSGSSPIICGITTYEANHRVQCWKDGLVYDLFANVSFQGVAGGFGIFCGVRYGGSSVICWNSTFSPKRIYQIKNTTNSIEQLSVGRTQICSITGNNSLWCWRDKRFKIHVSDFIYVSSGDKYTCGIRLRDNIVSCFGKNKVAAVQMEDKLSTFKFTSLFVGGHHVCGFDFDGVVICEGNNDLGQTNVPDRTPYAFTSLALGINHTCGIWSVSKYVTCWGGNGGSMKNRYVNISVLSFETIVAGIDFTCGLLSTDSSVLCWGIGWVYPTSPSFKGPLLPGPCVSYKCDCGIDPRSRKLCNNRGSICTRCNTKHITPHAKSNRRVLVLSPILLSLGSVGLLIGMSAVLHFMLTRGALFTKSSLQVETNDIPVEKLHYPTRRSSRQLVMKITELTLDDLNIATNRFSLENSIGSGGYGVVYKGNLVDGCEVAIKRIKKGGNAQVLQQNDIALLSRLKHKNLLGFVGYCHDVENHYLVYDYMKNGSLFDNLGKDSNILKRWKTRIYIALGAAKGIGYLHDSVVPPIAHGHVNSSNILLDENGEAYISDYGLAQTGLVYDQSTNAACYIDPQNVDATATTMSDVYAFGVLLLELMFGMRELDSEVSGDAPVSLVDYVIPELNWANLRDSLDTRVRKPNEDELAALQELASIAKLCLTSMPNDRPSMNDIIARLTDAY